MICVGIQLVPVNIVHRAQEGLASLSIGLLNMFKIEPKSTTPDDAILYKPGVS